MSYTEVFSEFEVIDQYVYIGEDDPVQVDAVGKSETTLEARTITKNKRGVPDKVRAIGKGTGTLTETLHVPYDVYVDMYGMDGDDKLKQGVHAYGKSSRHPEMLITQKILDEDGNIKYRAYPRVIISEGPKPSTENGVDEVKEIDVTLSIMPDEYGQGMYEVIESEMTTGDKAKWLTEWGDSLVHTQS